MIGTKIVVMMLCANVLLVLSGFTPSLNLVSSAERLADETAGSGVVDTASLLWSVPGLFIDVIGAPYALLMSASVPAEIKLVFGLPYATLYTMAIIYWIRGRVL